jgi:tripartite-type tricarboxylate transporter receptor subunit TctC
MKIFNSIQCAIAIAATGLALGSSTALAQEDYPNKPISMIVPFPPGGVADTVGRPIAEAMTRILKQPIIVENKAGAGGGVGMGQVAKAKADGYTLLMALSSITILPEADKVLNRSPLYQLNQFKAIARITADPTVLVVRADSPWKTFAEFIADVKKAPGKYTFGSSGNYGTIPIRSWCTYPTLALGQRCWACCRTKSTRWQLAHPRWLRKSKLERYAPWHIGAKVASAHCPMFQV